MMGDKLNKKPAEEVSDQEKLEYIEKFTRCVADVISPDQPQARTIIRDILRILDGELQL